MLIAAKSVLVALGIEPGKLFLSGWSQGGWTTMAYLEKLEGLGLPVTAAAVASGPVDIAPDSCAMDVRPSRARRGRAADREARCAVPDPDGRWRYRARR